MNKHKHYEENNTLKKIIANTIVTLMRFTPIIRSFNIFLLPHFPNIFQKKILRLYINKYPRDIKHSFEN